jgi:serine/threonine protein phosphatase PrpC
MIKRIFKGFDSPAPIDLEARYASAVFFSSTAFDKTTGNEDAAAFWELGEQIHLLAVADGMGGGPGGAEAAAIAIDAVERFAANADPKVNLRSGIVDAFEAANDRVLEKSIGSGTTLVVVEVSGDRARAYHAGDSGAILVGQRGRVRFDIMAHSPTGYAVASGLLEQDDVHHHDERHLLSNCIGSREMRVEVGAAIRMAARDTLMLGTDGVLDNIQRADLIDLIRVGPLYKQASKLQRRIRETMAGSDDELPAHPDDATALLFRRVR